MGKKTSASNSKLGPSNSERNLCLNMLQLLTAEELLDLFLTKIVSKSLEQFLCTKLKTDHLGFLLKNKIIFQSFREIISYILVQNRSIYRHFS